MFLTHDQLPTAAPATDWNPLQRVTVYALALRVGTAQSTRLSIPCTLGESTRSTARNSAMHLSIRGVIDLRAGRQVLGSNACERTTQMPNDQARGQFMPEQRITHPMSSDLDNPSVDVSGDPAIAAFVESRPAPALGKCVRSRNLGAENEPETGNDLRVQFNVNEWLRGAHLTNLSHRGQIGCGHG